MAGDIDVLALGQTCNIQILGRHHYHPSTPVNTSIPIVIAIDRRIVLVMTTDCGHQVLIFVQMNARNGVYGEMGFFRWSREDALLRSIG